METGSLKPPLLPCPRWPLPPRRRGNEGPSPSPEQAQNPSKAVAGASHPQTFPAASSQYCPLCSPGWKFAFPKAWFYLSSCSALGLLQFSEQPTGSAAVATRSEWAALPAPQGPEGQPFLRVEIPVRQGRWHRDRNLSKKPPAQVPAERPEQKASSPCLPTPLSDCPGADLWEHQRCLSLESQWSPPQTTAQGQVWVQSWGNCRPTFPYKGCFQESPLISAPSLPGILLPKPLSC